MAMEEVYVNMNEAAEWAAPDEHIYKNFNADSEKTVAAPSGPVPRLILSSAPSKRRAVWTVVIALLSALLLAALIFIVWTVTRENAETSQMKMRMTNLTSERDELQESNIDMKTSNHNLSAQIRLLEERIGTLDEELQDQKNRHANLRRIMETKCCPEKWVKFSTSVYLLSQNAKNWMDSKLECEELGASLVIISSKEEQKFVSGLTSQSVWIGLTDRETEGVWRWVNGDAVTTSYWRPGQPDNWKEEENCGEIPEYIQMWNDIKCSEEKHFICEKLISNGCNLKSNMDQ